jgi:hypothetical protein
VPVYCFQEHGNKKATPNMWQQTSMADFTASQYSIVWDKKKRQNVTVRIPAPACGPASVYRTLRPSSSSRTASDTAHQTRSYSADQMRWSSGTASARGMCEVQDLLGCADEGDSGGDTYEDNSSRLQALEASTPVEEAPPRGGFTCGVRQPDGFLKRIDFSSGPDDAGVESRPETDQSSIHFFMSSSSAGEPFGFPY